MTSVLYRAAWAACIGGCASLAPAGEIGFGGFTVRLEPLATGLSAPVQLTHAGDGSGRLFIVEQTGRIKIWQNGAVLATPFLDVSSLLPALNANFDERGLLGLAFHPDYGTNGRFFIRYSAPRAGAMGEPCFGTSRGCHEEVLAEYRVSAGNANVADAASGTVLLRVDEPQFNHNGGGIAFGPDGLLYFTLGDGGGANDGLADNPPSHGPIGNAQNLGVILGKVLRIDVSTPGSYAIPLTNPFVAMAGARGEVYAYGLRNPYAFSFDDGPGGDGRLIVADVGQNVFEEVDIVAAGGNYGWPIREGAHCFDPFNPTMPPANCQTAGLIDPVAEYAHSENGVTNGISIIGGFIYRGERFPGLAGLYLCGDFSTAFQVPDGRLFHVDLSQTPLAPFSRLRLGAGNAPLGEFVKGFGRDAAGEVYVAVATTGGPGTIASTTGSVLKIAPCTADINGSATVSVQDIFDFLAFYFANDPRADVNQLGGVTVQDIFDFIGAFFAGC